MPTMEEVRTLHGLLQPLAKAASLDTCYEPDRNDWTLRRAFTGHCGAVAYAVQKLMGGEVVSARDSDNARWIYNRLPSGAEVALTYSDPLFPPGSKAARQYLGDKSVARKITLGRHKRFDVFFNRLREAMRGK